MGTRSKEPDVSEFISAQAAGNNAQLMVMAGASAAESTLLALVAAAHHTGGRVVCIVRSSKELHASQKALGRPYSDCIGFVIGDAQALLLNEYKGADFVLIDCKMADHKAVLLAARRGANQNGALVIGYNAIHCGPWFNGLKAQFMPIGEGLMVIRIPPVEKCCANSGNKSHWVVEIDKGTGEEHVYRIRS